ncbi:VOC family protein [Methylacidimicrobium cyclopophantes]|nr:VOC family protein [Methylacidimicrobium cyclopophantes]
MRPNGILETTLYVSDLDAAEAFYQKVLGLERIGREKGRHVFFRCGESILLLFDPKRTIRRQSADDRLAAPSHGAIGPGHVAFRIQEGETEAWKRRLVDMSVPIEAEIQWPGGGWSLYFRDPEGNSLELASPQIWGLLESK